MCPPDTASSFAPGADAKPDNQASSLFAEVTRGAMVESRNRGIAAAGPVGQVIRAWGNIETLVYPRSSIKPIQALPLVEPGVAEDIALGDVAPLH